MNHTAFFEPEHRTLATELEAARLLVFQAAWNLDQARLEAEADSTSTETGDRAPTRTSHRRLVLASSMAKLFATETGQKVIDRALQIHGGTGLLKGTVVERLYREIRALRIYEGTSEIQKEIISRQLLKGVDG